MHTCHLSANHVCVCVHASKHACMHRATIKHTASVLKPPTCSPSRPCSGQRVCMMGPSWVPFQTMPVMDLFIRRCGMAANTCSQVTPSHSTLLREKDISSPSQVGSISIGKKGLVALSLYKPPKMSAPVAFAVRTWNLGRGKREGQQARAD